MGQDKLSLPVGSGVSMLEATVKALSRVPLASRLLVVRKSSSLLFDPDFYGFQVLEIGDEASLGMHRSLKLGLSTLEGNLNPSSESNLQPAGATPPSSVAVMICLGDQPFLRAEHYEHLLGAYQHGLAREQDLLTPMLMGRRGNPAVIHRRYFQEILKEPDRDQGCRYLFERYPSRVHAWQPSSPAFFQDLDTPEEYRSCLN
jgi:CTP:molybdopterin cytidylyltransferase MocA